MEQNRSFISGLLSGVLLTLAIVFALKAAGISGASSEAQVVARVADETLTLKALEERVAHRLLWADSDRYRILKEGAQVWVDITLLQKEARVRNFSVAELYQTELADKIRISPQEVAQYYQNNREQFPVPFDQIKGQIFEKLRNDAIAQEQKALLEKLVAKYNPTLSLEPPQNYVEEATIPGEMLPNPPLLPPGGANTSLGVSVSRPGISPSRGSVGAKIQIVEFADFQCGFCKKAAPTIRKLLENYKGKVMHTFRHFPLSETPGSGSFLLHEAATCAQEQGKFWEYHEELFGFSGSPQKNDLLQIADKLKINKNEFQSCLDGGKYRSDILKDKNEGAQMGIEGTPMFIINGQKVNGAYPYEYFAKIIDQLLVTTGNRAAEQAPPPSPVVRFDDLKGRPTQGPENAPITVVEFSDFHCPFCQRLTPTLEQLVKAYPDKIKRVWRHYPLPMHQGADRTHQASECAHAQGEFWKYHDKLFENTGGFRTDDALLQIASEIGLNKNKFEACLKDSKALDQVEKDKIKGAEVGVRGTPATFVNGQLLSGAQPYEKFQAVVESLLNPGKNPTPTAVPTNPLPTAPPMPSEPVQFNDLKGRPVRGASKPVITIVEFSDFHCPFCNRVKPTIEKIMENYGDKVQLVWRHLPLAIHPGAEHTHQASECAHEQGKFWPYHDKLFAAIQEQKTDDLLKSIAKEVGLNEKKFDQCLAGDSTKGVVAKDVARAKEVGARGTPAFFINGHLVSGAQPYEAFERIIKEELSKSS